MTDRISSSHLLRLRRACNVTVVAACLGLSALAGHTWLTAQRSREAEHRLRATDAQIADAQSNLERAVEGGPTATAQGSDAVAALKYAVTQLARTNGSSLVEFKANSEPAPFLTRFSNDADSMGWNQVEVQFTLRGAPVPLLHGLRQLASESPPFEFDGVELVVEPAQGGSPSMLASVRMRVLIDAGGPR